MSESPRIKTNSIECACGREHHLISASSVQAAIDALHGRIVELERDHDSQAARLAMLERFYPVPVSARVETAAYPTPDDARVQRIVEIVKEMDGNQRRNADYACMGCPLLSRLRNELGIGGTE
jgi:hypothetical protein